MPKPDQNVSSSAALQRPQRQKALPKPVAKEQPPKEDEISDGSVETSLASLDNELSQGSLPSSLQASQSESEASLSPEPKPKKVIAYQPGTVVAKAKPKLKPKDLAGEENSTEKSEDKPEISEPMVEADVLVNEVNEGESKIISEPLIRAEPDAVTNEVTEQISVSINEPTVQTGDDVVADLSILEVAISPLNSPVDNSADNPASDAVSDSESNEESDAKKKTKLTPQSGDHDSVSLSESSGKISKFVSDPVVELSEEFSYELMKRSPEELNSEAQESQPLESQSPELPVSSNPMFWCQAVGVVTGKYIPSPEAFHKGEIKTEAGFTYRAFVLSKAVKSLEKKTDLSMFHDFVVYPKTSRLHGVRFEVLATDLGSKIEEFSDRYFNIRGLVTKKQENSMLIEIQRRPENLRPAQSERFILEIEGEMPIEMVQQYVFIKCELVENYLRLISYEHLACAITAPSKKTERPILKTKAMQAESDQSSLDQN